MKAVVVKKPGGADQLEISEMPMPKAGKGELLIRVCAAGLNRTDLVAREGKMNYLRNPVLGVEVSGIVVDAGESERFAEGDRVTGLVHGGGYAEYAVMPEGWAVKIPDTFTFEEAAAIPEVFLTAYQTLFWIGRLQRQESVLIHAGASGVGTAAIQLAKQLREAKVFVTAGSKEKVEACLKLGADVGIPYKEQSFDQAVLNGTGGLGVDLILDFVGAAYWEKNLASIKTDGRWVLIGTLGGSKVPQVNLMSLMSKRIQLTGTLLTPREDAYKARLTSEFVNEAMPLLEKRIINPVIDRVYPVEEVKEAHERMEGNRNIGKIILTMQADH